MDRDQFDRLSRLIATAGTRRDALRLFIAGALAGTMAGADAGLARNRKRSQQGKKGKTRAQLQPVCPSTCNVNCNNKPIHAGVNLTRCDLNERDLDDVNLSGSNLTKTCFGNSSLHNVKFRGANVSGACFCGAELFGADFRGTKVTAAQLSCAIVGCNTILPNGKPAVVCGPGQTCCAGVCTDTDDDPSNCGACGVACDTCFGCESGECAALPDGEFDCNGDPLVPVGQTGVCTSDPGTGICDTGACNCGPGARVSGPAQNACVCNDPLFEKICENRGACCLVDSTCLVNGEYQNALFCESCNGG